MKSKLLISTLAVTTGLAIGGVAVPSVNAQTKTYKATPKKLRGTWHYHDKEFSYKLKITKNTLNQTVYQHGKKQNSTKISTRKKTNGHQELYIKRSKLYTDYWSLGAYATDLEFELKSVKHNGKHGLKLRSNNYSSAKPTVHYLFK